MDRRLLRKVRKDIGGSAGSLSGLKRKDTVRRAVMFIEVSRISTSLSNRCQKLTCIVHPHIYAKTLNSFCFAVCLVPKTECHRLDRSKKCNPDNSNIHTKKVHRQSKRACFNLWFNMVSRLLGERFF